MRFGFEFSNLLGTVYKQGNVVFTSDGNVLLSPVGNRVSVFDLVANKSCTLPIESRSNIWRMALSPNDLFLLVVDDEGYAQLINFPRRTVLHYFNFKERVEHLAFSPDGLFFAAAVGRHVQVWRTPQMQREFAPFVLHRTYTGHQDDVLAVDWSADGRFFVSTSRDTTARLYSLDPTPGFVPQTLAGHRDFVIAAFFATSRATGGIYTVARDGALYHWTHEQPQTHEDEDEEEQGEDGDRRQVACVDHDIPHRYRLAQKHLFKQNHARVTTCTYHRGGQLVVVGFSSGIFALYEMPELSLIHTLSISQRRLHTCAINATGDWLAFGSARLGQLLVWEWKSETHVLKQQGHFHDTAALAYSPDGQSLTTGGDDGRVKVWDTTTGFCYVTFREHSAAIVGVCYSPRKAGVVFTASQDGTVRAFDLVRYRNFRTFTGPTPLRFASLAVEGSGEVVCAGTADTNEVLLWSVQTGRLLEMITAHTAPVSCLSFSPIANQVVSGSWDQAVRVWDLYVTDRARKSSGVAGEGLLHKSDVLAVSYCPDGTQIAVATLDGEISFWDVARGTQTGTIDARRDAIGGRQMEDARAGLTGGYFSSLCYNADGALLLAGGRSRFVCIYAVAEGVLVRRFEISRNRSLDGVLDKLNSKKMTEAGAMDLIDDHDSADDDSDHDADSTLPGVRSGDLSTRHARPEVRVRSVRFSPTGRSWAAATTEGLLVFSLDTTFLFDPYDLDTDVTPSAVHAASSTGDHLRAICLALRLGEPLLLHASVEHTPPSAIPATALALPPVHLPRFLAHLAHALSSSPHLQYYLLWSRHLLSAHGPTIASFAHLSTPSVRALIKSLTRQFDSLSKMCDENMYNLEFLCAAGQTEKDSIKE